jgi:hypothetical protein
MSNQPVSQKAGSVARWFGLQVAAKAVSLALGAPVASGAVMGALAYAQGLPLAWGFLAVILAAAATATALNQVRSFVLSYSVVGKLYTATLSIERAMSLEEQEGYSVGVPFRNAADIALEYRVRRFSAHLDGRIVARHGPSANLATDGDVIEAGGSRIFIVGLVVMEPAIGKHLTGELEITYSYGRPGRLNNERTENFRMVVTTDEDGDVSSCDSFC